MASKKRCVWQKLFNRGIYMAMVWNHRPCKTIGLHFRNQFPEPIKKIPTIIIRSKNLPAFDSL